MTFDELKLAVPSPYKSALMHVVEDEMKALLDVSQRVGGNPPRAGSAARRELEDMARVTAQDFIADDVRGWLAGERTFTPEGVLNYRPRFAATWALARIIQPAKGV